MSAFVRGGVSLVEKKGLALDVAPPDLRPPKVVDLFFVPVEHEGVLEVERLLLPLRHKLYDVRQHTSAYVSIRQHTLAYA